MRLKRDFNLPCPEKAIGGVTGIPEYHNAQRLLTRQHTWRDTRSGLQFLAYGSEPSGTYATLFAGAMRGHLTQCGVDLSHSTWQAKIPSAFTRCIEAIPGQKHHTIPPGAHTWQSDIETVHRLIEDEFFTVEPFRSRADFFKKATTYQLFSNVARSNGSKGNRTPWDILQRGSITLTPLYLSHPPSIRTSRRLTNPLLKHPGGQPCAVLSL